MRELYYRDYLVLGDLIYTPVYILIVLVLALYARNLLYRADNPIQKYFLPGLMVKIIGGIFVGLIYFFYYGGGDSFEFFTNAWVYNTAFNEDKEIFWKLLMAECDSKDPTIQEYMIWMYFHHDKASFFVGKITGIINLFTFNYYTPCAILFAVLSFTGTWALYVTFCDIYPSLHKQFAIGVLFIPSVFFWGSGILKDSITFGCIGWITYFSYNIFFKRKQILLGSIGLLITGYMVFIIKAYILYAFAPSLAFWIFLNFKSKIPSAFLRAISGPIVFFTALGFGFVVIQQLAEDFLARAQQFQDYHGYLSDMGQVGSGYNLGEMDGTFSSVLFKVPAATNVTLFRPYLWEVRNPVMLLSAIESTIMMIIAFRIFYRNGIKMTFKTLFNNPTAFFCIFFAVFFGFCVGFSAYNFGALVRYKIPCIPFFVVGLYILKHQTEILRAEKEQARDEMLAERRKTKMAYRN